MTCDGIRVACDIICVGIDGVRVACDGMRGACDGLCVLYDGTHVTCVSFV